MRPKLYALPLAIASLLTQTPASFAQEATANAAIVCVGPVNITETSQFTLPTDVAGYKFDSAGTPRTLPFSVYISGRSVYDILSLSNINATVTGGPGCKLDVLQPVYLTFQPVPGEPGVYQANGQLQVAVGADTLNTTNRGTYYTCALAANFGGPMTITDNAGTCGTITQTITAIGLSFVWYRK